VHKRLNGVGWAEHPTTAINIGHCQWIGVEGRVWKSALFVRSEKYISNRDWSLTFW